jgi:ribonuclease-3
MENNLSKFIQKIEYNFSDQYLLEEALTHPSFSKNSKVNNYQRLEFLGDAILGLVIAEVLIKKYPDANEGELSKRQAHLVSGEVLYQVALKIEIADVIKFSEGEKAIKRNLENAVEALIGAIYLDSNLENAKEFILKNWQEIIDENVDAPKDPVSYLQEIVQGKSKKLPIYTITQVGGNSHQPIFEAVVKFDDKEYKAQGSSKKEAQKNVAIAALEFFKS